MFTFVTTWNLARPDQQALADFATTQRRGYNSELVSLTGQLANKIADKTILSLSVGDIADRRCLARRDLYLRKGVARLTSTQRRKIEKKTWGQNAGNFVQKYVERVMVSQNGAGGQQSYAVTRQNGDNYHSSFVNDNDSAIVKLKALEHSTANIKQGDTDWLLRLLKCNSSLEHGAKVLDAIAQEAGDVNFNEIQFDQKLVLKTGEIGLSSHATPDFMAPNLRLIGDVKTSIGFEPHFQLTCAGYALAYENLHGKGHEIDWGAIYVMPTRNPSAYVRPLTFAQLYIFAIDDALRMWFLNERDTVYRILAQVQIPPVKNQDLKDNCPYCKYKAYCEQ